MSRPTTKIAALASVIAVVVVIGARFGSLAESKPGHTAVAIDTSETTEAKIERAMSAGPPEIARSAKIIDKDAQGRIVVLREGSDGFTCMPGHPNVIGDPPMCADGPSMQVLVSTKNWRRLIPDCEAGQRERFHLADKRPTRGSASCLAGGKLCQGRLTCV